MRDVFNLDVHYDGDGLLDMMDPSLLGCLFPDGVPCPELGMDRLIVVNDAERYRHVTVAFTIVHEAGHYVFHYPKDAVASAHHPRYCRSEHIEGQRRVKGIPENGSSFPLIVLNSMRLKPYNFLLGSLVMNLSSPLTRSP